MNKEYLVDTETHGRFEEACFPAFDEVAEAFLIASHRMGHSSLQNYLDEGVAIAGAYFRRRAFYSRCP